MDSEQSSDLVEDHEGQEESNTKAMNDILKLKKKFSTVYYLVCVYFDYHTQTKLILTFPVFYPFTALLKSCGT